MDTFVSGAWHHYIIVETVDLELFRPLAGPRRTILEMEAILPKWIYHLTRIPFVNNRSLWFSFRTGFMIGWHVQQLVKLEMAFQLNEEGLLYCDSDVFFVRPFEVSSLVENGKFRFFSTGLEFPEDVITNPKFSSVSAKQLGLVKSVFPCRTYVENLVTWHRPTVLKLCAHIAQVSGKNWKVALGRNVIISEYALYGLYVDRILKGNAPVKTDHQTLCKTIWSKTQLSENELNQFCDTLEPHIVSIGVQSFAGIATERLEKQLQRAMAKAALN